MLHRRWEIPTFDPFVEEHLVRTLGISPLLVRVLLNRGLDDPVRIQNFLNASPSTVFNADPRSFYHPSNMLGMDQGVERIIEAIVQQELIAVHGDYDVDGITGTSLLCTFFREIKVPFTFYIPHRIEEGYDISIESVDKLHQQGVKLILTTDCGISAVKAVRYAATLGIDVIITDHHTPPTELPPAHTIINPKQIGCPYPFKELAGVGVAYFVVIALRTKLREKGFFEFHRIEEPNLKRYMDLVAIGTIADIVPLREINRVFVKHGLQELNRTQKPGIVALKELANCKEREVTSSIVGYQMAPRLNAAGRIGEAITGVEILIAPTFSDAHKLAETLDRQNRRRQEIEAQIYEEVEALLHGDQGYLERQSLVLHSPNWHPGVIGIVASRMVERYYRPTILISTMGGDGKGSGRSIRGVNMYSLVASCSDLLTNFGGHEYAVGLTIPAASIEAFVTRFENEVGKILEGKPPAPVLQIDAELPAHALNLDLVRELRRLEPFGHQNKEPIFSFPAARVLSKEVVGKRHLKMRLGLDDKVFDAIGFNLAESYNDLLRKDQLVDLAFIPQINDFYGDERLQLRIIDLRL